MGAIIQSIGTWFPERVVTNQDLEKILAHLGQETSNDWIVQRTGIRKRRIADEGETNGTMAVKAFRDALRRAPKDLPPVGEILVATNTRDAEVPNLSGYIQGALVKEGLIRKDALFTDLGAGCAGINYGIRIGDSLIRSGFERTIAVIGVDHLSSVTDYADRSMCVLFGDGASCYLLSGLDEKAGFMGHYGKGNGLEREAIITHKNQFRVSFHEAVRALEEDRQANKTLGDVMRMDGKTIFRYVVTELRELLDNLEDNRELNPERITFKQLEAISPHLANLRMFEAVDDKFPGFLDKCDLTRGDQEIPEFCNTSTASQGRRARKFIENARPGQNLLKIGYGGGLVFCTNLYKQPDKH